MVQSSTLFDSTTSVIADPFVPGRFAVQLDEAWSSLVGVHGGYLTAVVIRAAQAVADDRPIRTVNTVFLRPGSVGPAMIDVEVVRRGRSITNLSVTLSQEATAILVSQVVASGAFASTSWDNAGVIDLPSFESCVPIDPPAGIGHFEHGVAVLDPADLPFSHGPRARVAGYIRPREPRAIDAPWLGMALDWFPPASFTRVDPPTGGVSISYTIHLHRTLPSMEVDAWLGGLFHVDISAGGIALEKGLITAPGGSILAESFHTRWTAGGA